MSYASSMSSEEDVEIHNIEFLRVVLDYIQENVKHARRFVESYPTESQELTAAEQQYIRNLPAYDKIVAAESQQTIADNDAAVARRRAAKRARLNSLPTPSSVKLSNRFDALADLVTEPADAAETPSATHVSAAKTKPAAKKKTRQVQRRKQARAPRPNELALTITLPASLSQLFKLSAKPVPAKPALKRPKPATQCFACQGFSHRAAACTAPPRCVICSGAHASGDCERPRDEPATCANCGGSHPANYRGCVSWKQSARKPTAAPAPARPPNPPSQRRELIKAVCTHLEELTSSSELKVFLAVIPRLITASAAELAELAQSMGRSD